MSEFDIFLPAEPLTSLKKTGKTHKKTGNHKTIKKKEDGAKQGLEDQGSMGSFRLKVLGSPLCVGSEDITWHDIPDASFLETLFHQARVAQAVVPPGSWFHPVIISKSSRP